MQTCDETRLPDPSRHRGWAKLVSTAAPADTLGTGQVYVGVVGQYDMYGICQQHARSFFEITGRAVCVR